jgi:hypothetical protein
MRLCVLMSVMVMVCVSPAVLGQGAAGEFLGIRFVRVETDPARLLATPEPDKVAWYHTNRSPSIGNGRVWVQRPVRRVPMGLGTERATSLARYGASGRDDRLALVKVGTEIVAVSPWERFAGSGFARLNEGRALWLAERGFTGGVRTFRSPLMTQRLDGRLGIEPIEVGPVDVDAIEPAGWFRIPADVPRGRAVEHVRYSVPPGMDPRLAALLHGESDGAVASRSQ